MSEDTNFKSLSLQAIETFGKGFGLILRAAILPFGVSVAAVVMARWVGGVERYLFDALHGVMVISYLTCLSRIVGGTYPGPSILTFAVPRPTWPGVPIVKSVAAETLVVIVPGAFIMWMLTINIAPFILALGSTVVSVAAMLLVEFIFSTVIGLIVGAGMAKFAREGAV
ncbi:hypothetical protein V5T82_16470 [Magnetovibrio sp. PR-2]|uniref:hypothetical protein n=1 Tax=Magnetovibrio sp. PR-2 TaxID=3120356 RepID=UPI002FCDE358